MSFRAGTAGSLRRPLEVGKGERKREEGAPEGQRALPTLRAVHYASCRAVLDESVWASARSAVPPDPRPRSLQVEITPRAPPLQVVFKRSLPFAPKRLLCYMYYPAKKESPFAVVSFCQMNA